MQEGPPTIHVKVNIRTTAAHRGWLRLLVDRNGDAGGAPIPAGFFGTGSDPIPAGRIVQLVGNPPLTPPAPVDQCPKVPKVTTGWGDRHGSPVSSDNYQ